MTATIRLCRAVGERMKAGRGGVILTVGWDQAETGFEGESGLLFGPAKAAVMAFTRQPGPLNLAPAVRVNCLAPGWIKTAWGESASATGGSSGWPRRRPCGAGACRRTWRRRPGGWPRRPRRS